VNALFRGHERSTVPLLRPVHVVVLAAGRGSRLSAGGTVPKWLLDVGGHTIAERQLDAVASARTRGAVASVSVVVGHEGETIEEFLGGLEPRLAVVRNPEFAALNNWWSLLRGLRELPEDGPVLVMNADLLADPSAVAAFIEGAARTDADALICVDLERVLTDESMKVSRDRDGFVARIGKVGVEDAVGEYTGLLMARGAALGSVRAALESFVNRPAATNEWYEGAVARTAADGVEWRIWPMPSSAWVEIDDDADLDKAHAMVAAG
jgi:choline kinase